MLRPYITYNKPVLSVNSRFFAAAAARNSKLQNRLTVQARRDELNSLGNLFKPPASVSVLPVTIGGVPCEWILPAYTNSLEEAVVYIHGGSWAFGSLESSRTVGVMLAEQLHCRVLTVEYRLSPEHPHPAGLEDCLAVWDGLVKQQALAPENIVLFGDSAGGNLSLCLIQALRQKGGPLPAGVACASPVTDLRLCSALQTQQPLVLHQQGEDGLPLNIVDLYLQGRDASDPAISPVCGFWDNCPPILIHAGESEALRDDCIAFADRVHRQGGSVTLKLWYQMFHDFTIVGPLLAESRQSLEEIGIFLRICLQAQ